MKPLILFIYFLIASLIPSDFIKKDIYKIDFEDAIISSNYLIDTNNKYVIQKNSQNVALNNNYSRNGNTSILYQLYPGEGRRETRFADICNNETKVIRFSVFIPNDYPVPTSWNLIAQWWQGAPASPAIAFELEPNAKELKLRLMTRAGTVSDVSTLTHYNQKIEKDKWIDFKVRFKVDDSGGKSGIFQVWKNGNRIVNYYGKVGYTDLKDKTNFRFGIYRNPEIKSTVRAYYDDISLSDF